VKYKYSWNFNGTSMLKQRWDEKGLDKFTKQNNTDYLRQGSVYSKWTIGVGYRGHRQRYATWVETMDKMLQRNGYVITYMTPEDSETESVSFNNAVNY
jgi:hypothetical protein